MGLRLEDPVEYAPCAMQLDALVLAHREQPGDVIKLGVR